MTYFTQNDKNWWLQVSMQQLRNAKNGGGLGSSTTNQGSGWWIKGLLQDGTSIRKSYIYIK